MSRASGRGARAPPPVVRECRHALICTVTTSGPRAGENPMSAAAAVAAALLLALPPERSSCLRLRRRRSLPASRAAPRRKSAPSMPSSSRTSSSSRPSARWRSSSSRSSGYSTTMPAILPQRVARRATPQCARLSNGSPSRSRSTGRVGRKKNPSRVCHDNHVREITTTERVAQNASRDGARAPQPRTSRRVRAPGLVRVETPRRVRARRRPRHGHRRRRRCVALPSVDRRF